jgi:tRNA modification GTPase
MAEGDERMARAAASDVASDAWRAVDGARDTIVALATPAGRGAVALIRVSGPELDVVAGRVVRPWPPADRVATLARLVDPATGELIDRALVTWFAGGRSYTGEPMLEVGTHGGIAVPAAVVAAFVAAGAREALPGEFTRRAVLNGKLDLIQAEAVGDLIDARSAGMRRAALAQLDGGLSARVDALRERLLQVEALIAYDIDFPEEDDGALASGRVEVACDDALAALDGLLACAAAGELAREGALVVIAGPPNAGKSSLFNALVGRARALVTAVPGTTRDAVEAVVDAGPWPLRLVDTAGLRATDDVVERLGIEVAERYLADAQVVLACGASEGELAESVARVRAATGAPVVAVRTKADLGVELSVEGSPPTGTMPPNEGGRVTGSTPSGAESCGGGPPMGTVVPNEAGRGTESLPIGAGGGVAPRVVVSAERGTGLRELVDAVVRVVGDAVGAPVGEVPLVTRARQRRALAEARAELGEFRERWSGGELPAPVAAVHLRSAVVALETLIGAVGVEDVLDRVFASFCVGK